MIPTQLTNALSHWPACLYLALCFTVVGLVLLAVMVGGGALTIALVGRAMQIRVAGLLVNSFGSRR